MKEPGSQNSLKRTPKLVARALAALALLLLIGLLVSSRWPGLGSKSFTTENRATAIPKTAVVLKMSLAEIREWLQKEMRALGTKHALVNIWATWCAPCRNEMPELARFSSTGSLPLFLISADNETDIDSVQSFLSESGVISPSALIAGDQDAFVENWQKQTDHLPVPWSMTLPSTFLIDSNGNIQAVLNGETSLKELESFISRFQADVSSENNVKGF